MNATFYFENKAQAEKFSKELRKCFILSITCDKVVEIYNFSMIKEECKRDVLGMAKKIYKEVTTDMNAVDKFHNLTMDECIDLWNKYATDQFHQLSEIRPMEDEKWWNRLANELGAWDFMHFVWNSGENFNDSDLFFAYNEDFCEFFSFSTKQELVERIGEQFFIDVLTNEE